MARPANVTHVVLVGHLGGQEVFNTGFWFAGATPTSDAVAATVASDIAGRTPFAAFIGAAKAVLANDSGYDAVRVYGYPTAGGPAEAVGEASITSGTGTGGAGGALQVCMVATLQSAAASRSGRGRMYLPCDSANAFSVHRIIGSHVTDVSNLLAAALIDLNTFLSPGVVSVVSPTHGVSRAVTGVRVNDDPDIQRRHANKQTPTVTSVHPV